MLCAVGGDGTSYGRASNVDGSTPPNATWSHARASGEDGGEEGSGDDEDRG